MKGKRLLSVTVGGVTVGVAHRRSDDETIIRWYKMICKTYGTCFNWNEI